MGMAPGSGDLLLSRTEDGRQGLTMNDIIQRADVKVFKYVSQQPVFKINENNNSWDLEWI